jgi:hypothetical protein
VKQSQSVLMGQLLMLYSLISSFTRKFEKSLSTKAESRSRPDQCSKKLFGGSEQPCKMLQFNKKRDAAESVVF